MARCIAPLLAAAAATLQACVPEAPAKTALDRVRLDGPLSNRALLGSGWADVSVERFEQALVPLEQALAVDAADDMALINLAFARRRLGEPAAAIDALRAQGE